MARDKERETVINILGELGFDASEIPEEPQQGRRADIRATKNSESYIIEVKSKEDHIEFFSQLDQAQNFEIIPYEKPLQRSNTFGKIIREGAEQLKQTPDESDSFKCIWFRAVETLIPDAFSFMKATLYGTRYLFFLDDSRQFHHATCYYFDPNEFFKFPYLDAVILDNGRGVELCVNSLSRRYKEFSKSALYLLLQEESALIDPLRLEAEHSILVADTNLPRSNEDALIRFIQEKYRIHVQQLKMNSVGAALLYTPE